VRRCFLFAGFNSTLDQLEDPKSIPARSVNTQFQFHTGSIRRWQDWKGARRVASGFNSTLDQLEELLLRAAAVQHAGFNSTLDQLEEEAFGVRGEEVI